MQLQTRRRSARSGEVAGEDEKSGDFWREAQATESQNEGLGSKRGFRRTPGERNLPVVLSGAS